MQGKIMHFLKTLILRMAAEFAIDDLSRDRPDDIKRIYKNIEKYGYPDICSEREYFLWDEFSKRYGLEPPRWKREQYSTTQ